MNTPSNEHGIWNLSVQLLIDYEELNADYPKSLYEIYPHDKSSFFSLKRKKKDSEGQESASFFVAEANPHDETLRHKSKYQVNPSYHLDQVQDLVIPSCNEIQLSSFRYYYKSKEERDEAWSPEDPPIMKPYLDIGFEQRPPEIILGESSGTLNSKEMVVVGLGLLLYQIGCCRAL